MESRVFSATSVTQEALDLWSPLESAIFAAPSRRVEQSVWEWSALKRQLWPVPHLSDPTSPLQVIGGRSRGRATSDFST